MPKSRPLNHIERCFPKEEDIDRALDTLNGKGYRLIEISTLDYANTSKIMLIGERVDSGSIETLNDWSAAYHGEEKPLPF